MPIFHCVCQKCMWFCSFFLEVGVHLIWVLTVLIDSLSESWPAGHKFLNSLGLAKINGSCACLTRRDSPHTPETIEIPLSNLVTRLHLLGKNMQRWVNCVCGAEQQILRRRVTGASQWRVSTQRLPAHSFPFTHLPGPNIPRLHKDVAFWKLSIIFNKRWVWHFSVTTRLFRGSLLS